MIFDSSGQNKTHPAFRDDINALRAWAVLAVMLFHFGVPGFSGGFVGVDVFFVISGFLITGNAIKSLDRGVFSLWDFYSSRIHRIFPALIFLCFVVLLVGWILLAPDDYSKLGRHARDSLIFVSNHTYRSESGYFDSDAHEKWLLHTWSLSVEWQFYVFLPVLIFFLWKINKSHLFIELSLAFLLMISLLLCIDKTASSPDKAFYFLKYRCWELLAGGVAYFLSLRYQIGSALKFILTILGFLTFFYSVAYFDADSVWPGSNAVLPVIAGIFIVLGDFRGHWVNSFFLIQWIGTRSYSIYLWHWPLVVFLAYFDRLHFPLWIITGIFFSLVLGECSYRFIEQPARNGFGVGEKNISTIAVLILASGVIVFSQMIIGFKGFPERVPERVASLSAEKNNINRKGKECVADNKPVPPTCVYGGNDIRAIVLGDSHANTMVTGVVAALDDSAGGVYYWGHLACPFIKHVADYKGCSDFNDWALKQLHKVPADIPLIIISRFSYYAFGGNEGRSDGGSVKPPIHFYKSYDYPSAEFLEEFKSLFLETVCEAAATRQVFMIRPVPELKLNVPQAMARAEMMGRKQRVSISLDEYNRRHSFIISLEEIAKERCGIKILDPLPYLCDKERCYGDADGWPLYFDDDHLSEFGNKRVAPMYEQVFVRRH